MQCNMADRNQTNSIIKSRLCTKSHGFIVDGKLVPTEIGNSERTFEILMFVALNDVYKQC